MAKKRLVVGNWKMYIESSDEAKGFALSLRRKARGLNGVEAWLAPPATFLPLVADTLSSSPMKVGAQTISSHNEPAHTGEVSGAMLKDAGALFALIGHSERRVMGESNTVVRASLEQAIAEGLTPILCVGEHEREAEGEHFEFIEQQLDSALRALPIASLKKLIVAYEPVWAIGKHAVDAMQPGDVQEMVIFIRKILSELLDRRAALRVPILYGGSVEPQNAEALIKEGGVNGFLVGHASANIDTFFEILKATQN